MKAINLYVVIKKETGQVRTSKSGLDIPSDMADRFIKAKVISISEKGQEEYGVKAGDDILYDKHAGNEMKSVDGETYHIITCNHIAVVL